MGVPAQRVGNPRLRFAAGPPYPPPARDRFHVKYSPTVHSSIDYAEARKFIESIPKGRWTSYADVAEAGGASRQGGIGAGSWLRAEGSMIPNVYRVLTSQGTPSGRWRAHKPGLPSGPSGVTKLLRSEGILFDDQGRAAQDQRWTVEAWRG